MIRILLQKRLLILPVLAFCILGSSPTVAKPPTFTETYDIPTTPCEGLSLDGVENSFTIGGVPSANCEAGSLAGPGVSNNINDPSIVGDAEGVLHLTFDHPTTQFGFGVALNTLDSPQPQSVIVHLFRPGHGT